MAKAEYNLGDLVAGWRSGKLIVGWIEDKHKIEKGYYSIKWFAPNDDLDGEFSSSQVSDLRNLFVEQYHAIR